MDQRMRDALDRYITGNYGEDQFKGDEVFYCGMKDTYDAEPCDHPECEAFSQRGVEGSYEPSPEELRAYKVADEALRMAVQIIRKELGDPEITEERAAQMLEEAIDCFLDRGLKED